MFGGWTGKILRINLTDKSYKIEDLNYDWAKKFIGGRGLAVKYFTEEVSPDVDPLSPENKLIMATGPLTGTYGAANGRYMVITKAPLTGTIASSNSGGYFPSEMKYAGFDMIIFEGKADKPVYVTIYNQNVEIRDASHLWGKTTDEVEDIIREEFHGDAKIASIGPAGEKLVKFACVMNDKHRAAGRSGVGAVMGSKNLKAVAIRGTGGVKIAKNDEFRNAAFNAYKLMKEAPVTSQGLPLYGTAVLVNVINENGLLPTKNFQFDTFEGAQDISGEKLAQTYLKRNKACMGCIIGCGRVTQLVGEVVKEGPEYETIWALGADCGVSDLKAVTKANYICNEYGMDPITAGATLACAMEMYEKGLIPDADVDMPLRFGDPEVLVTMIEKMAKREGFGDKLAEGSYKLSEMYGDTYYSMSVKKLEFPAYDGRVAQGMAINYATNNRGACHVRGYLISPEILGIPEKLDPTSTDGKAEWCKAFQDVTSLVDSSGICLFTTFAITATQVTDFLNAAIGFDYPEEYYVQCGERVWNLERLFNLKAGIDPKQDTLPKRILEEPVSDGPHKGSVAKLSEMLPKYYEVRGWSKDGIPTEEKLKELDLA
ncbi:aldehyde ferredoxin oxidoreductase family protein [Deferribacter autotrophicus]|uniref:Aldehyde ferredoxin oxidoreductase family protein n=1 Tax=Deferribacter autotrophicus TaxID=500465 RepID=A0A5A8F4X2_9BACT|nr:aldehyde ferredoxin oxidoreductase family protein [Deferribacter autotrophicus]KAA0258536.1 aldehyde ferredoxin oxidoreductase family protein [Deferribacter autotrophicus]